MEGHVTASGNSVPRTGRSREPLGDPSARVFEVFLIASQSVSQEVSQSVSQAALSYEYRSQVIGGKLLIGQLAPWVTWDIWRTGATKTAQFRQVK